MSVTEVTHPLAQHKLGLLRDESTSTADFRVLYELDPSPLIVLGRTFSTAADLGTVALTWFLAKLLYGRHAALAAVLPRAVGQHRDQDWAVGAFVSIRGPGRRPAQWDSRVTSLPLEPTRKSRSAPVSAPRTW